MPCHATVPPVATTIPPWKAVKARPEHGVRVARRPGAGVGFGTALLALQTRAGNHAVARLVAQRQPTTTGADGAGDTAQTKAPAVTYIIPFDRAPQSAAGERVIFNARLTDPSPADYQLEYSTTGGHFTTATGPVSRTVAGLVSGNVDFFVPTPWDGKSTVAVVLKVRKISDSSLVCTETWNFGLKKRTPTTITQQEGTGERNLPAIYNYLLGTYLLGPAAAGERRPPRFAHQTILERFGSETLANVVPADIKPAYRATHKLNSAAEVSAHFLNGGSGQNGTFIVDEGDGIGDRHGGHPDLSNLVTNLVKPKEIEAALPQTYEATPGTTLGIYTITRVLKADGTTWKVKKG